MTTTTAARALLACLLLLPTPTTTTSLPTSTSWSSSSSRRRWRSVRTVEYAGGHPFDAPSGEKEEVVDDRNVDVHFVDERWPTSSSPIASAPPPPPPPSTSSGGAVTTTSPPPTTSLYRPMRIVVNGRGLVPLATNDPSGYYADLTEYVAGIAGPDASKFWGEHLSTIPVTGELIVSRDDCPLAWSSLSSSSSSGGGSGGAEKDGNNNQTFVDADLVIYLLMDNGPCTNEDPPIAMSDVCLSDQYDRPIAGKVLLCTSGNFDLLTSDTVVGAAQRRRIDEVLRHEFAHVLGMSGSTAPYWRDREDGNGRVHSVDGDVRDGHDVEGNEVL